MFSKSLLLLALIGCSADAISNSPPEAFPAPGPTMPGARPPAPPPPRASPIAAENRLPGDTGWQLGVSQNDLAAYADRATYEPGDAVAIAAAAQRATTVTWELWRLGYYGGKGGRRILSGGPVALAAATAPTFDPRTGMVAAGWQAAFTFSIPDDAVSGVYLVKLMSASDQTQVILTVREAAPLAPILVTLPFNTYQAYNPWGGTSLYQNFRTDWPQWHAYAVSFDRPFAHGSGAGDFFFCDRDFVTFAEAQGWDMDYVADVDLDADPALAAGRRLVIVEGHAEYWSAGMRAHLESAIASGTNAAFLGANDVYWQVRFDEAHRIMTGYKEFAAMDPAPAPELTTTMWRDPVVGRPENGLIGVMFGEWVWSSGPLVIADPNAWIWSGTDVQAGSFIAGLYGIESDRRFANGAEPRELVELGAGVVENHDGLLASVHTTLYRAPSGASVFAAGSLNWPRALAHAGMWDPRVQQATANLVARLTDQPTLGTSALAPMMLPPGQAQPIWRAGTQVSTVTTNLMGPVALAIDAGGNAVVVDQNRIVRVMPSGAITLVAGGAAGFADGPAAQAQFQTPHGIALGSDGTIYVADTGNFRIRAISPAGLVSTLAGSTQGFADGASAQFSEPMGLARLSNGTLVVADSWNARIRAITPAGVTSTLAGNGTIDFRNGPGAQAELYYPFAVAALPDDSIVFLESDDGTVRKVANDSVHTVSVFAGGGGVTGWGDGPVATAQVYESVGIAATPAGDVILLDAATYRVRALHAGTIDTLAGGAIAQTLDGAGTTAGFVLPRAAAALPDGSLLVAEAGGHALRRIRLP